MVVRRVVTDMRSGGNVIWRWLEWERERPGNCHGGPKSSTSFSLSDVNVKVEDDLLKEKSCLIELLEDIDWYRLRVAIGFITTKSIQFIHYIKNWFVKNIFFFSKKNCFFLEKNWFFLEKNWFFFIKIQKKSVFFSKSKKNNF